MSVTIYNTLSRTKEPLITRDPGKVSLYVCGPTVYNLIHIGNTRTFLSFDMIRRYLEYRGFDVSFVQNITDVDDKIINKAADEGSTPEDVARRFTEAFQADMAALGVSPPTEVPKATEFIPKMVEMIERLVERGHAYYAEGDVFFSIQSFPSYGKLSGRSLDEMRAGERVEIDQRKQHPMDFVLWKASKPGEPAWESPWGPGRPGWHIECSAMSFHHLGEAFDIHGGAQDLIFPHHENEIAQSEGALGEGNFARQWLHAGLLQIDKEKMSKSVGNIALLRDLLKEWSPQSIRMLMLKTHYRQPLDFSNDALAEAREAYRRIEDLLFSIEQILRRESLAKEANPDYAAAPTDEDQTFRASIEALPSSFEESMDDDFNTAEALAHIFEAVRRTNGYIAAHALSNATRTFLDNLKFCSEQISNLLSVLGVDTEPVATLLPEESRAAISNLVDEVAGRDNGELEPAEALELLLRVRETARVEKDWGQADLIRNKLREAGILIEDTDFGPQWKPVRA